MLFAGVEGGGTSTTVALSCDGQLLGTKTGGASNPFLLGENAVVIISSMIRDLVQTLVPENLWTTKSPPLRAVVMTMSGFGRREDAAALEAAVLSSGLAQECVVAGDGAGPLECLHAWLSLHRNRNRDRNRNRNSYSEDGGGDGRGEGDAPNNTMPPTHGVVLISGTGSACFCYDLTQNTESTETTMKNSNEKNCKDDAIAIFRERFSKYQARAGGRGHLMGDHGSAYWIGQQALSAAFLAQDGMLTRPSELALVDIATEFYDVETLPELIPLLHETSQGKTRIAAFAERVVDEARTNVSSDATYEIVVEAAEWLARMTSAVIPSPSVRSRSSASASASASASTLAEDVHVVVLLVGSVWKSFDMLRDSYMERLMLPTAESTIDLVRLEGTAAFGCLEAAVRLFGNEQQAVSLTELAANSAVKIDSKRGLEL